MPPNNELEKRLWEAADQLRANSKLRVGEYSVPVLGLIFLKYADVRFQGATDFLSGMTTGRRQIGPLDYQAKGVLYLPEKARYSYIVDLPEGENIGQAINDAMKLIEGENTALKDVLPKTYNRMENFLLVELLRIFNAIPMDIEGDMFGRIYEYFLGKFAAAEGQRGGEFFTPTSIVKLIVEIMEPYNGRILDPACGSGGMFVQSAYFVDQHQGNASGDISIYGQEKTTQTVRLAKMNLAVHGLEGDIRSANSYYEDPHKMLGKFDFVMANPPFNVDGVDFKRVKGDPRLPFGIPTVDNANYMWIQYFYSALNETGRAGFVMANSAGDAQDGNQRAIREELIREGVLDVMISVSPNFFHNVPLPCTLWFLSRGDEPNGKADTVLFIDARKIYVQVERSRREYTPEQIEFIGNIARLYRGETPETWRGSSNWLSDVFPDGIYQDIPGLCKVATLEEIEAQRWSLNPGRYVGVAAHDESDDFDFRQEMTELYERLELLNAEAREIEERISENMLWLLENGE